MPEDATVNEKQPIEHVEPVETSDYQLPPPTEEQGSMAAFLAMRKRQKEEATAQAVATITKNVVAKTVLPNINEEEEEGYVVYFFASSLQFFRNSICIKKS